ncbi:MAG: PAS domain S-box protein [Pyrinomonadaceae bacterium]
MLKQPLDTEALSKPIWDLENKPLAGLGLAVVSTAAALFITSNVEVMWQQMPFGLFFAAVVVTTRYAGRIAGGVAIVLSVVACDYFIIPPLYSLFPTAVNAVQIGLFVVISIFLLALDFGVRKRESSVRAIEKQNQIEIERARLQNIVAHVPGVVWESWGDLDSADHRIDFVSDYVETLLGYTPEEWRSSKNFWLSIVHPDDREQAARASSAAFNGQPLDQPREFRWRKKSGEYIWVEANSVPILDDQGDPIGMGGVTIDITARKRAEDERRILAEIMEGVLSAPSLSDFLKTVHRSICKLLYAENCFVMLGEAGSGTVEFEYWVDKYDTKPASRTSSRGFSEYVLRTGKPLLISEDSRKQIIEAGEADQVGTFSPSWVGVPLRTNESTIGVLVLQHYESENAYTERDLEFLTSVGDQVAFAIDRRRGQEALVRSEERFRSVVETAPDVIITIDEGSRIIFVNPAVERVFGYTPGELIGEPIEMLMPDRLRGPHATGIARYQETGIKRISWDYVEVTGLHKTGHEIPITLSFSEFVQAGRRHFTGIIRDISDRKQAMEALQESEERYRDLFENAIDIIYTQDLEGNYISINKAAERITGYTREEALGMNMVNVVAPAFRERARTMIAAKLAGQELSSYELEIITKQGRAVQLDVNSRIIYDNGVPVGIQGIARDITERKKAEATAARLVAIVESSDDAIISKDLDGIVTSWNAGAEAIFGYAASEIVGRSISILIPANREHEGAEILRRVREGLNTTHLETVRVKKDGSPIDISITVSPIKDAEGKVIGASKVARDITQSKLISDSLIRSEWEQRELSAALQSERLRLVEAQALAKLGSWHTNLETMDVIWSDETHRIFETDPESFHPKHKDFIQLVHPEDREAVNSSFFNSVGSETESCIEHRILLADGRVKFVEERWQIVHDANGEAIRAIGTVLDITERKNAQSALLESNQKFHELAATIDDVFWIRSHDMSEVQYVSPAFEKIWGRPVERLLNSPDDWISFIFPDDREGVLDAFSALGANSTPLDIEYRIVRPDGDIRWIRVRAFEIRNEEQVVIRYAGVVTDITDRKIANDALRESEARYHSLFENMIEGYAYCEVIYGEDGELVDLIYLEVNRAFGELTGLTDVVGKRATELIPTVKETNPELFPLYGGVASTGRPAKFETFLEPLDVWLSITLYSPDTDHLVAVFENITESKRVAGELAALSVRTELRERMLTMLLSSMTDFAQIYDNHGRILFVNQPLLDLWNKSLDEVVGKNFHELEYPEDLATRLQAQLDQVFKTKQPIVDESAYAGYDGIPGYYEYIFSPAIGPEGNVDFVVGSTRDVTERKLAEEMLRSSEEDLSRSQRIAHLGSWEMDVPETLSIHEGELRWSDEVFRIFGYMPNEIEVTSDIFFNSIYSDDRSLVLDAMASALYEGKAYQIDHRIMTRDGHVRFVDQHCEVVRDDEAGRPLRLVGTIQDVTSQKELGEQLRQSQKMEAIGVLAGGIAHDFNNLLTAINGYSDLTLRGMEPEDPFRNNVKEVREAGERAAELTGQLLAISRKQVLESEIINLNTVVSDIENMLRRLIRENIDLQIELDPELGNVKADPGQIEQVIMNLVINAGDAMPEGGMLTIRTENFYLDQDSSSIHLSIPRGHFIKLTVIDTGAGMDPETQSYIFDPFFTTKPVGKGTGLGLSTVYGIVKQSGGDVRVSSERGHGTSFDIYLPSVDDVVQKPRWNRDEAVQRSGTETILVVEDEEIVRNLVCEILNTYGYNVLVASDGESAISICLTYQERIHLLLTDVIMPRMGGRTLEIK